MLLRENKSEIQRETTATRSDSHQFELRQMFSSSRPGATSMATDIPNKTCSDISICLITILLYSVHKKKCKVYILFDNWSHLYDKHLKFA